MKIDDAGSKLPPLPTVNQAGARAAVGRTGDSAAAGPKDKVSLSGTLQALSVSAQAPIDLAKVEKIRAAIADGSFLADAGQIADGLIASTTELAARRQQDK